MTASYQLQVKGQPPRTLGSQTPRITVGRAAQNDWIIQDASLSRQHAQFTWDPRGLTVQDLGSRFGTSLNGAAIQAPAAVRPGDELILGTVLVEVALLGEPTVHIDPQAPQDDLVTFTMPAAKVRSGAGREAGHWAQALPFVHDLTLDLIRDVPPEALLETLLDKLLHYLEADRGVVLLKDAQGVIRPSLARVRGRPDQQITVSHTLVEAAVERREALLLTDPQSDPALASQSLIQSGVTTAIVTPLEAEGEVTGLLYFDSRSILKQFTRDDLQLVATLAHVAAAKLHSARLMAEVQKSRSLEHEMGLARNIQLRMLPRASAELGPFDLYARLRSAKEVGGDLYDYQWRQGRLRFCIGDVSGKGVPAALVMALAKTLFRAAGGFEEDPARLMAAVNDHLCEVTGSGIFVTAFCGWFDPADGRLVYCNAGHEPPLLLDGGEARFLPTRPGLALGILPEYPYQDQETVLREGEAILLYTDGVTEAENAAREQYTPERLRSELSFRAGWTTLEVVRHLQASVDRFAAGAAQADDITALCLRRTLA